MDDLEEVAIEENDVGLRWKEGGGQMPLTSTQGPPMPGFQGLAHMGNPDAAQWYKNPTVLTIIGVGLLIALLVYMNGTKSAEQSESLDFED
jgi:hypothetical protein